VTINPLAFIEVDDPWAGARDEPVTAEHILRFLGTPGTPGAVDDLIRRYKAVSVESPRLFAAPAEARLLEKLIWPLRQAKGSYMLGNFFGTISLCGMVGEMAAILIFDLADLRLGAGPIDVEKQKALFGSSFERLGQERRVEVLRAYGVIDETLRGAFNTIRECRRRYLHFWSTEHTALEDDARNCFKAATLIVVSALGLDIREGKLVLRPEIHSYLAEHSAGGDPRQTE
jgi:hypothetical protein